MASNTWVQGGFSSSRLEGWWRQLRSSQWPKCRSARWCCLCAAWSAALSRPQILMRRNDKISWVEKKGREEEEQGQCRGQALLSGGSHKRNRETETQREREVHRYWLCQHDSGRAQKTGYKIHLSLLSLIRNGCTGHDMKWHASSSFVFRYDTAHPPPLLSSPLMLYSLLPLHSVPWGGFLSMSIMAHFTVSFRMASLYLQHRCHTVNEINSYQTDIDQIKSNQIKSNQIK